MTRRRPSTITRRRCVSCGLRLHLDLVDRGIREHVLCSALTPAQYDAALSAPPLRLVTGGAA